MIWWNQIHMCPPTSQHHVTSPPSLLDLLGWVGGHMYPTRYPVLLIIIYIICIYYVYENLKNAAHDLPAFAKSGLNLVIFPALQRLMQLRAGREMNIFWALTPGVMGYGQIFAMAKVGVGLRRDLQQHCPLLLQLHTWHICKLSGFCT